MGFFKSLLKVDKRLAGSFVAAILLAIIFFVAGALYERQPRLRYTLVGQAPVYDVHEDVPDLDIIFRGKSIRQEHRTLSVLTVRIENGGNAGLTLQSFDPNFLPGIRVTDCQIVKITPDTRGNDYLRDALHVEQRGDTELVFGPMIFDKGDSFVLKFLLLHGETQKPRLESFGKVAGVAKIEVISVENPTDQRGFFARALSGGLAMQAFRALIYFIGFLLCVAIIGGTIAGISTFFTRQRRKRRIKIFARSLAAKPTKQQRVIFDVYQSAGAEGIVRLNELLADSESVARAVKLYRQYATIGMHRVGPMATIPEFTAAEGLLGVDIGPLIDANMIQETNDTVTIDPVATAAAGDFESFLLHHDPEKVLTARRQRQRESYGTDEGPAETPEVDQQHLSATTDTAADQRPDEPPAQ